MQFKGQVRLEEMLPMHDLLGLDKQLRNVRDLLKVGDNEKGSVGTTHKEEKAQALRN